MKSFFSLILLFIASICNAQTWETLEYNPDQANLELNPLKGLTPLYNENNGFPHSIRGRILNFGEIMNGIDDFNWSLFDNFIEQQANQGRFSYLQVNVDMGKPESQVQLPAFLVDDVPHFYYVAGTANEAGESSNTSQLVVDYNDPEMMEALLNFIQRFGERYGDDDRVFLVHYGLYGVFGEWFLGFGENFVPDGENWEMSPENQQLIADKYNEVFVDKNLLARKPANVPEPQDVGYSDGFYFGGSISDEPQFQWFFLPLLEQSNADQNWKLHPIGGEVDPDVQATLWSSFPNTNVSGQFGSIQNTEEIFNRTHPTFLFQDHIFNNTLTPEMWDNAIKATKYSGYTFHINEFKLSASNSNPAIEVNIQNKGIAPMYANWDVEFGYLDTNGDVVSIGTDTTWNLKTIQPEVTSNYRSFISDVILPDGTYSFLLKVVNPLEDLIPNPSMAQAVRFANTTQDRDNEGWLSLGELTISGGNAGEVPTAVSSISITPETAVMGFESELQLTAEVLPANATNPSITWVSNRPSTVSVDENGLLTAYTIGGLATITGYTEDGALSAEVNISVELPFFEVPGLIQAELFSSFNNLQVNSVPDTEEGGGEVLGFIGDDTWMEYMIKVDEAAEFLIDFRASSFSGEGLINILNEANDTLGSVLLAPLTGNYDIYRTYTSDVISLPAGEQILRLDVVTSSFNLNWIEFRLNPCPGQDPSIIGDICDDEDPNTLNDRYNSICSCAGIPADEFVVIPSLIEAEDFYQFADGGEQINSVPDGETGDSVVGFINDDTWLDYAVTVEEESDFTIEFRASNPFAQAVINILNENGDVLGTVDFMPDTGGDYDTYDVFTSSPFVLPVGDHVIRLDVVKSAFNLNWIEFKLGPCGGFDLSQINTACDDGDANTENDRFSLDCECIGIPVDQFTNIPALIEAEDFYDVFNVQVNGTPVGEAGEEVLGFIADNTWMEYAVNVSEEASFVIDARASSFSGDGFLNILNETGDTLGTIALMPSTGSYDVYANYVSTPFTLPVGYHKLRLDVVASAFNLNWVDFQMEGTSSINELDDLDFVEVYPNPVTDVLNINVERGEGLAEIKIYDLMGRLLYRTQTLFGKAEVNVQTLNATKMIFVQIIQDGLQTTRKIILE